MTRRAFAWAGAGLFCGGLLALLLGLPAAWVLPRLVASGGPLQLVSVEGTVWNGSAVTTLGGQVPGSAAQALPGRLHWRLRPDWPWADAGWARLTITQDCCASTPLTLRLGGLASTLRVEPLRWQGDLRWLSALGAPWNTLELDGQVNLVLDQPVTLRRTSGGPVLDGQLELQAADVATPLAPTGPLGSYAVHLQGLSGPGWTFRIDTTRGPLELKGDGRWEGGQLRGGLQARAAAGHEAAMANILNLIGNRSGAFSVRIQP